MRLILVMHGSTSNEGSEEVKSGIKKDLSLTKKGKSQAVYVAKSLKDRHIMPDVIYLGELSKCIETGYKIAEVLGLSEDCLVVDNRIDDIDYGKWTGLTNYEIIERYGEVVLDNWERNAIVPENCGFLPQEDIIKYNLRSFLAEVIIRYKKKTVIAVVSDCILKFIRKIYKNDFEKHVKNNGESLMETGRCVDIQLRSINSIEFKAWNVDPIKLEQKW